MTREEFEAALKEDYTLIKVLSDKNGTKTLLLENNEKKIKTVLKILPERSGVYEFLDTVIHKNLPAIYGAVPLDGGYAIFEEFIDGASVADTLEEHVYAYGEARKVVSSVCDALGVLHTHGFVHRDVKPENVMIARDGSVKLIDFNVSREYKEGKERDTVVAGTIGYMSPEQYGVGQSDPRADVYSVGVLLNVMLTGCHPSEKLCGGRARHIVEKCTHIDPDKRYKSAADLKAAL